MGLDRRRVVAASCALTIALVAGGSVWCEPLCSPADTAAPSCHASASAAASLATPHDCSTHSLDVFTLDAQRAERSSAILLAALPSTAEIVTITPSVLAPLADRASPPFRPQRAVTVLRI